MNADRRRSAKDAVNPAWPERVAPEIPARIPPDRIDIGDPGTSDDLNGGSGTESPAYGHGAGGTDLGGGGYFGRWRLR